MTLPPSFSVIVPTHDRPGPLAACLASFRTLEYPRECFEIIVVDDGSTPQVREAVERFARDLPVTLARQERRGPARARNHGAKLARGVFLAFTDDDCAVTPGWLGRLANALASAPGCAAGGRTVNALPENHYSAASQLLVDYLYAHLDPEPGRTSFLTTNNFALRAEEFRALGGFDESYDQAGGEDRDFCRRWVATGRRLVHVPEATVRHAHALTLGSYFRQHMRYGRGAWRFHSADPHDFAGRRGLNSPGFYLGIPLYPFARREVPHPLTLSALLVLAQQATAAGLVLGALAAARRR